jgi:hypothetical protein
MISNIKDTLVVSLLMIASLSFVENAIAGPYSGAVYQGEEFLGWYRRLSRGASAPPKSIGAFGLAG